jgi:fumarylpyruvate hydrolase
MRRSDLRGFPPCQIEVNVDNQYIFSPPPRPSLAIIGMPQLFPVRRLWCVGRNYVAHIHEMGQDARAPPFFFAKPADALSPDGSVVPYPPLTHELHFEVELVVALKGGGRHLTPAHAGDMIYGYAVGIDLTRRDLQITAREAKRPWEIGKAFDFSAPCSAIRPAVAIGHPLQGRIRLTVNGVVRQDGDLGQLIWSVPEIIAELSAQVALAPGDVIFTGTPAGVGATVPGDRLDAEITGVGTLGVTIGPRA